MPVATACGVESASAASETRRPLGLGHRPIERLSSSSCCARPFESPLSRAFESALGPRPWAASESLPVPCEPRARLRGRGQCGRRQAMSARHWTRPPRAPSSFRPLRCPGPATDAGACAQVTGSPGLSGEHVRGLGGCESRTLSRALGCRPGPRGRGAEGPQLEPLAPILSKAVAGRLSRSLRLVPLAVAVALGPSMDTSDSLGCPTGLSDRFGRT